MYGSVSVDVLKTDVGILTFGQHDFYESGLLFALGVERPCIEYTNIFVFNEPLVSGNPFGLRLALAVRMPENEIVRNRAIFTEILKVMFNSPQLTHIDRLVPKGIFSSPLRASRRSFGRAFNIILPILSWPNNRSMNFLVFFVNETALPKAWY